MDCSTDPTGTVCTNTAVDILNQARATMGQPAYVLPADFDTLSPVQQLFILTNDDRTLYGLAPIPGLTGQLNQDAATGIQTDSDPWPSGGSWMAYASNWAGGFSNVVLAYDGWMYDDGPNSGNLDCTDTDHSGCWGHRHDVLWEFGGGGPLAMGAAVGTDPGGMPSFTMLLVEGNQGYQPSYSYTWAEAVADGAGGPAAQVGGSGSDSGSGSGGSGSDGSGSTGSTGAGTGSTGVGTGSTGSEGSGSTGSTGSGTGSGSGSGAGSGSGSGSGSGAGDGSGSGSGSPGSGSGGHSQSPGAHGTREALRINRLQVFGHRIWFQVADPSGLNLRCALRHFRRGRWHTQRSKRCAPQALFQHVPEGHYRLRITSAAGSVSRRVVVR